LLAWVAQAGYFDYRRVAEPQTRAGRQAQEVQPAGGNVFPHLASRHAEAARGQLVVEFGVHQVNLAQVGLRRIARYPRTVLDGDAPW
jgi:hypothetical protein